MILAFFAGLACYNVRADVAGFFETQIEIFPQSSASEIGLIDLDVQNDITVNISLSGIRTNFHSHFGIAGVEDVIVTANSAIGFVELSSVFVLARFASGSTTPFYPTLHFLKKQLSTEISIGGVKIENVATIEDTSAFTSQTPAYGFGDVISLGGTTPSGVTVSSQTSICQERVANTINEHVLAPFSVSQECATEPKPDTLFEFERITVANVPIDVDVTASAVLDCLRVNACNLTTTFTISGGIIPFQTQLFFREVFDIIEWNGASILLPFDFGFLSIIFGSNALISQVRGVVAVTLNPEENPADFSFRFTWIPGLGLTNANASLAITRGPLRFSARATFSGGPPLEMDDLFFDLTTSSAGWQLAAATRMRTDQLVEGSVRVALFF